MPTQPLKQIQKLDCSKSWKYDIESIWKIITLGNEKKWFVVSPRNFYNTTLPLDEGNDIIEKNQTCFRAIGDDLEDGKIVEIEIREENS